MDINPALHHALIPKLTLQPLVENALYHGIKLKRSVGMIQISGKREGDTIVLQVADNGAGMTADRLEALRRATKSNTRVGFGLSAVHHRLHSPNRANQGTGGRLGAPRELADIDPAGWSFYAGKSL